MNRLRATYGSLLIFAVVTVSTASDLTYPPAGDQSTPDGRLVWLGTCESCHAYGIAGAPNPLNPNDWINRVSKPKTSLYQNAISGFFGPGDTYMPPKGGNDQLTDDEVKSAVDYMVEFASRTLQLQENEQ